jgi:phosphomannomutase
MRQNGAIFGGELSGHFYFADNYVCDSGEIAFVSALSMLSRGQDSLSKRAQGLRRYHASGEINFHVEDKDGAIARLRETYKAGRQDMLDGITVEFGDLRSPDWWWFNVRASNTEPLLRLNLEARTAAIRDQRKAELVGLLGAPVDH